MSRRLPSRLALVCAALLPALAWGASVYLNGVKIDGVTNQKFEKATVRIDEQGNVLIQAPGYAVKVVTPPPTAPVTARPPLATTVPSVPVATLPAVPPPAAVPPRITRRYWLATEQTVTGMTEFDIDVYVNAKWVMKLRNSDAQTVVEITRHLVPGKNSVLFAAHKVAAGTRRSLSAEHRFKIVVGEGNVGGDRVLIDNPLIRFQRTAADAQDVSQEFTLSTR